MRRKPLIGWKAGRGDGGLVLATPANEGPPSLAVLQVFEPRRFVELRKQSFWRQVKSAESFGMGLFYTLNVFFIQFYLGARPSCPSPLSGRCSSAN